MRNIDFSSWQALLSTLFGLSIITLLGVGIRLLLMQTIQVRRERENRRINERLRTLIAAYKTLGGSFTGELAVDPTHLRELRQREATTTEIVGPRSDRARRMRDAVEGALSDILLLGTDEQVRLASAAASQLVAGQRIETAELVISLRAFIRSVLELEPVPAGLVIPRQGPSRPSAQKGGKGDGGERSDGGGKGGGGGMGGGGGGGGGMGGGSHHGSSHDGDADNEDQHDPE